MGDRPVVKRHRAPRKRDSAQPEEKVCTAAIWTVGPILIKEVLYAIPSSSHPYSDVF